MANLFVYPVDADNEDDLPPALIEFYFTRSGDQVVLHLQTEDGRQLSVLVRSFDDAAWLQHETSEALASMIASVRNAPYPARRFAEVVRRAKRPDVERSRVSFDPRTGAYGYHLHFPKQAPISMVLTEPEIERFRAKQQAARSIALAALKSPR